MFKILVIDEDTDVLKLLRTKLSSAGYDVSLAINGAAAWERIEEAKPDIVINELLLPDIDGFELLAELKAKIRPKPMVLILSSRSDDKDISDAFANGADDFVSKPFSPAALVERLRVNLVRTGEIGQESGE